MQCFPSLCEHTSPDVIMICRWKDQFCRERVSSEKVNLDMFRFRYTPQHRGICFEWSTAFLSTSWRKWAANISSFLQRESVGNERHYWISIRWAFYATCELRALKTSYKTRKIRPEEKETETEEQWSQRIKYLGPIDIWQVPSPPPRKANAAFPFLPERLPEFEILMSLGII